MLLRNDIDIEFHATLHSDSVLSSKTKTVPVKTPFLFAIFCFCIGFHNANGQTDRLYHIDDYGDAPECQWAEQFGGTSADLSRDLVTDEDGFIYITGSFSGMITIGSEDYTSVGERDAFVARIDPADGDILWFQPFGAASSEDKMECFGITVDNDDHLYITGYYTGAVNLGSFALPDMGPSSYFYARLDMNANVEYAAGPDQSSPIGLTGKVIKVDGSGNVYMMVSDQLSQTTYLQNPTMYSFQSSGELRWTYNGTHIFDFELFDNSIYYSGTIIEEGYVGNIFLDPSYLRDAFLARSDLDGNFEWAVIPSHNSPTGYSEGRGLAIDGSGGIYQCGYCSGDVIYGNTTLTGSRGFVVKADINGGYSWANSLYDFYAYDLSYGAGTVLTASRDWFQLLDSQTGALIRHEILEIEADRVASNSNGVFYTTGDLNDRIFVSVITQFLYAAWTTEVDGDSGRGYCIGTSDDQEGFFYSFNYASNEMDFLGQTVSQGLFLARQDMEGSLDWTVQFPGAEQSCNVGRYVMADPAHHAVYITGSFISPFTIPGVTTLFPGPNGSIYVIKFNNEGGYQWHIQEDFRSAHQSVSVDAAENVVISGIFDGTINIGDETLVSSGDDDAYVARYNPDGAFQWAIKGGGEEIEYIALTTSDQAGNIYFAGEFTSVNITFGDQSFTMAEGDGNIALAKITPAGQVDWFRAKGGCANSGYDYYGWPTTIAPGNDGFFYVKGAHGDSASFDNFLLTNPYTANKNRNLFIAQFDPSGNTQWAHTINQSVYGIDYNQMDIDPAGSVYFGGQVRDVVYFEDDFSHVNPNYPGAADLFIAKYSPSGMLDWVKIMPASYNLSGRNWLSSLSVIHEDELIMGGYFFNNIDLGPITLSSRNQHGMIALLSNQVGIPDLSSKEAISFTISPNPSSGILYLDLDDTWNEEVRISITDLSGRVMMILNKEKHTGEFSMDASNLPSGVYLLKVEGNGRSAVRKFIIR